MKIAIVTNTAWNIVNFRLGLIKTLIDNGHEVVAIAPKDEYVPRIEACGCRFIPLKKLDRKGTNPIKDLQLIHELYRIYKKENIEISLHYTIKPNIYGTFAASLSGAKVMCIVTGLGYSFINNNWISRLAKKLYRIAFKRADIIAFQNEDDRQLFLNQKLSDTAKSILIRGSGIKCDYFLPMDKIENSNNFVFLFVGRLLFDKGIKEFINAAEKIKQFRPNTNFWVVGALDTENPSCIDSAYVVESQQKNIISYFGTTDNVIDFIRNADCVVLPSYREGLPRVMLEAISMAKPIITTDAPGCRDTVIDNVNGFMVPVRDAEALSLAMSKMLKLSEPELKAMGQKGRELALDVFDEKRIVEKYLDLIDKKLKLETL